MATALQGNAGFVGAALTLAITFVVHTFIGGRFAARPLLAAERLPRSAIWLNYLTWHMVTALIVVMAAAFCWAALHPEATDVAVVVMVLCAALSLVTVGVSLKAGVAPWRFPSSYLFIIASGFALWDLVDAA